jgi:hypothetical protein
VVQALPSLRASVDWLREARLEELPPELEEPFAKVDELMTGQLLWAPFAVPRRAAPDPVPLGDWAEGMSISGMMVDEGPPDGWLTRAVRALSEAGTAVNARRDDYQVVADGGEVPPSFPRGIVPQGRLFFLSHLEFLRSASQLREGRIQSAEWLGVAPARVEDAIWALGRAADQGRAAAALKIALHHLDPLEPYCSPRIMVIPPSVLLGRRAETPEGRLLELEVGRTEAVGRSRIGVPETLEQELETLREIRAELPAGDWRARLTYLLEIEYLCYGERHDDALARTGAALRELLVADLPPWLAVHTLVAARRIFHGVTDDSLWGEDLARAAAARLASLSPRADEETRRAREVMARVFARRRARDDGFSFVGSFE